VGLVSGCDAAGEEQLGEDLRQVSRFGESRGFFSVGLGNLPALDGAFGWVRREGDGQKD
jgi:hypothetical protein